MDTFTFKDENGNTIMGMLEDGVYKTADGTIIDETVYKLKSAPTEGGRRHKGSKKMHKNKRHGNASLRAWVTFVKKVQKEEGIGYKEAMSVAKKRKDSGEKWRGGSSNMDPMGGPNEAEDGEQDGGRRRRTRARGRSRGRSRSHSRSHKRSRSHRRSRRHH